MGRRGLPQLGFRFGSFSLDSSTNELRRNGTRLKLHGQPMAILRILLEHPGQMVSREALREAIWSDETFVEFEHGLNSNINRLRAALGDHAERPRFIETLPGRGYRFIAHVESDGCAGSEQKVRVAVLPFTCAGAREGFAEALTAQMVVELTSACSAISIVSTLPWLHGRSGQHLRAEYLVAATVWPELKATRIVVQLVRTADSCCTWGATYAFSEDDALATVNQMAADISSQVARA